MNSPPPPNPPLVFITAGLFLLLTLAVPAGDAGARVAAIGMYVLFAAWLADRLFFTGKGEVSWVRSSVNPILSVFFFLCALQLVPLPAAVLEKLSPIVFSDKVEAFAILGPGESPIRAAAAYAPRRALVDWLTLASGAAAFFLFLNTLTSRKRITAAVLLVTGLGAAVSVSVLLRHFSETLDPTADRAAMGMLICALPAAIGLYLSREKRTDRIESGLNGGRAAFQRLVGQIGPESVRPAGLLLVFAVLLIGAALFVAAPPSVRLVAAISLTASSLLFFAGKRNKKGGLAFLAAGAFFLAVLGAGPAEAPGVSARARSVPAAARDYPLLGMGLGSFENLYPRYKPLESRKASKLESLEAGKPGEPEARKPDPLSGYRFSASQPPSLPASTPPGRFGAEISAEAGVFAFALVLFGAGYLVFRIGKIRHRRRDLHAAAVGTGAGGGFLSLLLIGLTGPAALTFPDLLCAALLAAAAKAAVFRRGRGFSETFFYRRRQFTVPRIARPVLLLVAVALATAAAFPLTRHLPPATRHLPRAGEADAISASLTANPAQPRKWLMLGRIYDQKRSDPYTYLQTWMRKADRCFAQAVSYAPADPEILSAAAGHFVERAAMLPRQEDARGDAVIRFQHYYRRALSAAPHLWKEAADRVWTFFPEERIVLGIVPEEDEELRDRVLRYLVSR